MPIVPSDICGNANRAKRHVWGRRLFQGAFVKTPTLPRDTCGNAAIAKGHLWKVETPMLPRGHLWEHRYCQGHL